MNRIVLVLFAFAVALVARVGHAEPPPKRTVFALVVTNNHGSDLGRPDLHYADDDGVKYAELFRMIAPEQNVHLLTELDRDTEALAPHLKGKLTAPTKGAVERAKEAIARDVKAAVARGEQVDFYFVFAGHGDVDQGKGFLVLRDGRFTADEMEALLKAIPATKSHVILDSCNSYFVLSARKPGGRRVPVPEDAVRSLRDRLPTVGVFLSTSAEAEVFEWSELGAGVFSHAVRSGLMGAADANQDGVVSYDELKAFIQVATSKVKNPLYRPKVFASGPSHSGSDALFRLTDARAARVEVESKRQVRLTVRDRDDLPWIDLHKEAGHRTTLYVPSGVIEKASFEEHEVTEADSRIVHRFAATAPSDTSVLRLAELSMDAKTIAARGPNEALRMLFGAPFGPNAMAQAVAEAPKEEEASFGVSREDVDRMRLLLWNISDMKRFERRIGGSFLFAAGAAFIAVPTVLRLNHDGGLSDGATVGLMGAGVGTAGLSMLALFGTSEAERLHDAFAKRMAQSPRNEAAIVAETEEKLRKMARDERYNRWGGFGMSAAFVPVGIGVAFVRLSPTYDAVPQGGGNYHLVPHDHPSTMPILGMGMVAMGLLGMIGTLQPTPLERLINLWNEDPSLRQLPRPGLSMSPVFFGTGLGVEGTF